MSKYLYIMRHAKSDWVSNAGTDFSRPLSARGLDDTATIGQWFSGQVVKPERILASPALRARQTIENVCASAAIDVNMIEFVESMYLADLESLLAIIAATENLTTSLLLVGHNPGMEELVDFLCAGKDLSFTAKHKMFTTGNVAYLELQQGWQHLQPGCAKLLSLVRPKELMD